MSACKNNNNSQASHLQPKRNPLASDDLETGHSSILVTHFVNPQFFCFATCQQLESNVALVNHVEAQLAPFCELANQRDLFVPDKLVIVRYLPLHAEKLLRGRVIACQDSEYVVWAMDYGFSLTCRWQDLWLLPAHLCRKHVEFSWGGVAGIAPHAGRQWSKMARRLLEQRLEEAQHLLFRIDFGTGTQHSFGQLLIKPSEQKEPLLDAAKYLLEKQLAQVELDKSCPVLANSFRAAYDVDLAEVNDSDIKPRARILTIMELMQMQRPKPPLLLNPNQSQAVALPTQRAKYCNAMFRNGYHQLGARTRQLTAPAAQAGKLDTLLRNWTAPVVPDSAKRLSKVASCSEGCVATALQITSSSSSRSSSSSSSSSNNLSSTDSFDAAQEQRAESKPAMNSRRNVLSCYKQQLIGPQINEQKSLKPQETSRVEPCGRGKYMQGQLASNIKEEPAETRKEKSLQQEETAKLQLEEQPPSGTGKYMQRQFSSIHVARYHINNIREEPKEILDEQPQEEAKETAKLQLEEQPPSGKGKYMQRQLSSCFFSKKNSSNIREEPAETPKLEPPNGKEKSLQISKIDQEETPKLQLEEQPPSGTGKYMQRQFSSIHVARYHINNIREEPKEILDEKPLNDAGKFPHQKEAKETFKLQLDKKTPGDAAKSLQQQQSSNNNIKEITAATQQLQLNEQQQLCSTFLVKNENIKEQSKRAAKLQPNGKGTSMQQVCINFLAEQQSTKQTPNPDEQQQQLNAAKLERIYNEYARAKCNEMPIFATAKLKPIRQRVLAHSHPSVLPMDSWPDSLLDADVLRAMGKLNVDLALATQRYSWPHLMRGNSLLLVDRPSSGRSWCYLPAVCSLVMRAMRTGAAATGGQLGPLALLLADSTATAELLAQQCSQLMAGFETQLVKVVGSHSVDTQIQMLLNSCGILVTTVSQLQQLLLHQQMALIDPRRLKYLILDDYDRMRCTAPKLLTSLVSSSSSSSCSSPLQLILIAQQWHARSFPQLAKRFGRNPLLLFGDFLEAAVYGSIKLHVTVGRSSRKTKQLLDYLAAAQKSQQRRTVIYCKHEQELESLRQDLTAAGHECIASNEAAQQHLNQLLLLTDAVHLSVGNCELLVHYSLPDSWTRFSYRFHAVSDQISNILAPSEDSPRGLVSYVMLDESNVEELPRLVRFLDAHNIKVAEHVHQMVASCRQLTDQTRSICAQLLSSGECVQLHCSQRHQPLPRDVQGSASGSGSVSQLWQPETVVRCHLVKVYDPVHLAVVPVSYRSSNSACWRPATNLSTLRTQSLALDLHMSRDPNRRQQQSLAIGDVCVLRRNQKYHRVRIVDTADKRLISVQLMDDGTELIKVKPHELLECPARFAMEPPLAMDVRLCGFLPCWAEGNRLTEATSWVRKLLNGIKEQQHLQLIVQFAMFDVVYVRDITVLQDCPTLRTCVKATRLHEELLSRGYAKRDERSLQNLRKLHEKINLAKEKNNEEEVEIEKADEDTESAPEQPVNATSQESKPSQMLDAVQHFLDNSKNENESETETETETEIEPILQESAATFVNVLLQNLSGDDAHLKAAAQHLMQDCLNSADTKILKQTLKQKKKQQPQAKAQLTPAKMASALCCAAIAGNAVRPRVRWHQTRLHIELIFEQQVPQYELHHRGNVLVYEVRETTPPQRCILNLLGEVRVVSEQQHGYQLHVKLAKDGLHVLWPSLLASLALQQHSAHWLVYDSQREQSPQTDMGRIRWMRYLRNQHQREDGDEDNCNWSPDEPSEPSDVEREIWEDI